MGSNKSESFPGRLEISGGKLATFEHSKTSECNGKIVVKSVQSSEPNLTVYRVRKFQKIYLAFCFEKNQQKYVLGLEGEKICFEINAHNTINDFTNKFLFRWDSTKGSFGTLSSVDKPRRYLCVCDEEIP
ncbi:hypothetical protein KOW79_017971 [Hemibagrus wyckioides]|uniref:Uncharacterized protein n=1 Tax=Hemibagrus wyckioides TaxID=337641 RepID=A0A9D3SBA5_9TELE|nr:hypothetical protein KOW79_017971 [Hemibagrus wyckioides]